MPKITLTKPDGSVVASPSNPDCKRGATVQFVTAVADMQVDFGDVLGSKGSPFTDGSTKFPVPAGTDGVSKVVADGAQLVKYPYHAYVALKVKTQVELDKPTGTADLNVKP